MFHFFFEITIKYDTVIIVIEYDVIICNTRGLIISFQLLDPNQLSSKVTN